MVKRYHKVIWDKKARASLRGIHNYIKKRESEQQAARVRDENKELARSLGFMPHKYARDPLREERLMISATRRLSVSIDGSFSS